LNETQSSELQLVFIIGSNEWNRSEPTMEIPIVIQKHILNSRGKVFSGWPQPLFMNHPIWNPNHSSSWRPPACCHSEDNIDGARRLSMNRQSEAGRFVSDQVDLLINEINRDKAIVKSQISILSNRELGLFRGFSILIVIPRSYYLCLKLHLIERNLSW
jgi:hypothetical protein